MKTGFSKICINPPYGSPIVGYYEPRFTKGILDNLYVRAVAFDDGENKALIISLDLIELGQKYFDALKDTVNQATGVKKDAIFINCSHTHTGPLVGKDPASDKESDEVYDAFLISCVRDAAIYAIDDLKEATIETAEAQAKNISFIRRYRMKDGSVATNPGVNNKNIDCPLGKPNETVKLVKIIRENADDIFIVNFGTHPDTVGGEYISADYMGYVCSIIENAIHHTQCMFLQAPQGDVNHVNVSPSKGEASISEIDFDGVPRGIKHAEHMGRAIAGAVLSVCSVTEKVKSDKISFKTKTVELPSNQENNRLEEAKTIHILYETGRANELPYKEMALTTAVAEAERIIKLQNGPAAFTFTLSAIRIGDIVFAGIGGEPFTEVGNRICRQSPFGQTILCCLTSSAGTYIPANENYAEGGYEVKSSVIKPGGDDIIVEGMIELLNEL